MGGPPEVGPLLLLQGLVGGPPEVGPLLLL